MHQYQWKARDPKFLHDQVLNCAFLGVSAKSIVASMNKTNGPNNQITYGVIKIS
jgi:spore coat protein CotF